MSTSTLQPKLYLATWFLYPVLVPFYFFGKTLNPGTQKLTSGVPQVADYYLLAVVGLVFANLTARLSRPALAVVGVFAGFVGYTALINLIWAAELDDLSLLKSTLFYAYDGILFVTCLTLFTAFKDQFLKVTVYAVGASALVQALLSPLALEPGLARQALFFNDENQLGYFCVLAATILVAGTGRFTMPARYQILFYGALAYLAVIAQCRAALAALMVLMVVALIGRPVWFLLLLGGLAAVHLVLTLEPSVLGKSEERLVIAGEYDTLETRGYDRLINYPEFVLFGAGEGAYQRFRSALYASELHSSYGTLLFCYGIPGTMLFTFGLLLIARSDPRSALFLVPALVYGFAHQGLRCAFFWVMLAFLCCLALERKKVY